MTRLGPSVDGSLATLLVVAAGVVVLSVGSLSHTTTTVTAGGPGVSGPGGGLSSAAPDASGRPGQPVPRGGSGAGRSTQSGPGGPVGVPDPATGASCAAGRNGGSTDRGVNGHSISLGATVVSSGIGASFLGPVRLGLEAVKDSVNRAGGICGRTLSFKLVDDGWDPQRGQSYIHNLIEGDKVFALAVNPSSEGLRLASNEGYFAKTSTPVVGSDGMLNSQYVDPWVWPVAASTVSTMHIIANDAYTRLRARHFSIVYDSHYHFGVEGAFAFNAAVKRLTGKDIPGYYNPDTSARCSGRFCAIEAGKANYAGENKAFRDACQPPNVKGAEPQCDFVVLLLEPNEALTFIAAGLPTFPAGKGFAQTLFSRSFAKACGNPCDQALVWTGYNPPIEALAGLPAVGSYVNDIRTVDPNADIYNQFLEGGYAGMKLLVAALQQVGPDLTRERLKAVLDSMRYDGGLSTPLQWQAGNHYANTSMRAFAIQFHNGFNGFKSVGTWVKDPWVGLDAPGSRG